MGIDRRGYHVPNPPSSITGDLLPWMNAVASYLNSLPNISVTSYNGGPNSHLTGAPGDLCINVVSSAQTKRLYIKEQTSGTTGWVSVATIA